MQICFDTQGTVLFIVVLEEEIIAVAVFYLLSHCGPKSAKVCAL